MRDSIQTALTNPKGDGAVRRSRTTSWKRLAALLGICALGYAHAAFGATDEVDVINFTFSPVTTNINVNDTIHWVWKGNAHSTTSFDSIWDSGVHNVPFTFDWTFAATGNFEYLCTVHGFTGTINVAGAGSTPSVSITNPANGAAFIAPANVTIQASASDTGGTITNVQFFNNSNSIGNAVSSPYQITSLLPVGTNVLTAVATDSLGAQATSATVTVTVISNTAPTVSLATPTNTSVIVAPATIVIAANASDPDGTVTNVQFLDGTTTLTNMAASPFGFLTTLSVGSHTLTAKATDNDGTTTTSAAVTVTVVSNVVPNPAHITSLVLSNKQPSPPVINVIPVITNGLANYSWHGDANGKFDLLYSTTVGAGAVWNLAQPNIIGSPSGSNFFTDPPYLASPAYPSNSQIFYRLKSLPPSPPALAARFQIIATNLVSPIALTGAGDGSGRIFIEDQVGLIYIVDNTGTMLPTPFLNISNNLVKLSPGYDERGLLGLAFHPGYSTNGRFFVYYAAPSPDTNFDDVTRLSEFAVSSTNANVADPNSERILLTIPQPQSNHKGAQINFGPDGYLYFGPGDGGLEGDPHGPLGNGQVLTNYLGKMLRIDVNSGSPYAIPSDNPFIGVPGALPEIYAYGLRNPWRFSFDRGGTHQCFVADVGQNLYEELDILVKGGNFGWKIMEGNHIFDPTVGAALNVSIPSLVPPIFEYPHGPFGIAIIGGFVYRGSAYPGLVGKYVFGDFSTNFGVPDGQLYYLDQTRPGIWEPFSFQLLPTGGRFNRFVKGWGEDDAGEIYVLSTTKLGPSGTTGDVRRLLPP